MKNRILILLLFLGLISCKKAEVPESKFVGIWYDTEYIIPNKTILKINKDSTFDYKSAGCQWRLTSKGKWKVIGDSIELNSVSKDICDKLLPFVSCIPFEERKNKELSNCNFNEVLYFSKERFFIKNDSLVYKLKPSSQCPDTLKIVFAKTQKIRK